MKVAFKNSFVKDLKNIKDRSVLTRIQAAITAVEAADSLSDVVNCKKLQGGDDCYRIRVGDFRMGLVVEDEVVKFVRFLSRGDIYKHFP